MTAAKVTVENGSSYADYDVAADSVTFASGTPAVPYFKIMDGTASSVATLAVVAEDAASAGGETGLLTFAVRRDTPNADTSAYGDFATFQVDAEGSLWTVPKRKIVSVTADLSSVTTSSTNYTAGDVLGAIVTLTGVASATGRSAIIHSAVFVDNSDVMGAFDVYLFDTAPSAVTDNAAPNTSDSDALNIVGVLQFAGFTDLGGTRVAQCTTNLPLVVKTNASANLSAMFVTRTGNAFFTAATTERLKLLIEQF
jgi:hypothetical protein